jgi:ribosomal-protein-serine acetyltransferase
VRHDCRNTLRERSRHRSLTLRAIDERYVSDLHQLVVKNKRWLQQSLSWPAAVDSEDETRRHVQGNVMLHQRGYAKMFLLFLRDEMVACCRSTRLNR